MLAAKQLADALPGVSGAKSTSTRTVEKCNIRVLGIGAGGNETQIFGTNRSWISKCLLITALMPLFAIGAQ
jgi:hypothetical protein